MAGGGGDGNAWIFALVGGVILCGIGYGLEHAHAAGALVGTCLAIGGLAVVFGSCEAMIKSVERLGERLKWNQFVAGTIAGLASNLPEIVMLAFVIAKEPRVAFVIVMLTLHVSALAFGAYSVLLPRDASGQARMPEPLVKLSTDLFACAGGAFLATGSLMLIMRVFQDKEHPAFLGYGDLYALGGCLLFVEVVAVTRLVQRFSAADAPEPALVAAAKSQTAAAKARASNTAAASAAVVGAAPPEAPAAEGEAKTEVTKAEDGAKTDEAKGEEATTDGAKTDAAKTDAPKTDATPTPAAPPVVASDEHEMPSWGAIAFFGVLGVVASIIGGHSVGEFADILVTALKERGYSEMVGAIVISIFACSGAYLMIATAHFKGMYDLALANVSGQVNQVPFVVLPISMILIGAFAQFGVVDPSLLPAGGGALAIDLETTSVVLLAFPIMLILWKSIQDDGKVNWLETASMCALFGLTIYFLAAHG